MPLGKMSIEFMSLRKIRYEKLERREGLIEQELESIKKEMHQIEQSELIKYRTEAMESIIKYYKESIGFLYNKKRDIENSGATGFGQYSCLILDEEIAFLTQHINHLKSRFKVDKAN